MSLLMGLWNASLVRNVVMMNAAPNRESTEHNLSVAWMAVDWLSLIKMIEALMM